MVSLSPASVGDFARRYFNIHWIDSPFAVPEVVSVESARPKPSGATRRMCQYLAMHLPWLNRSQRVVVVVGLGVTLYLLGAWLSAPVFPVSTGWVGYAPLSTSFERTRLSGGADLIVWLVLILLWVAASSYLLRTRNSCHDHD